MGCPAAINVTAVPEQNQSHTARRYHHTVSRRSLVTSSLSIDSSFGQVTSISYHTVYNLTDFSAAYRDQGPCTVTAD